MWQNKNVRVYSLMIMAYVLFIIFFHLFFKKGDEIKFLSLHYSTSLLFFFNIITLLADWQGIILFAVVSLLKNKSKAFPFAIGCVFTAFTIQFLKRIVFAGTPRPRLWAESIQLTLPEGTSSLSSLSLPSGHTAIAVTMGFCLCLLFSKKEWAILFGLLAILVGISRVYIMAHFALDTAIGASIGLTTTWLGLWIYEASSEKIKKKLK